MPIEFDSSFVVWGGVAGPGTCQPWLYTSPKSSEFIYTDNIMLSDAILVSLVTVPHTIYLGKSVYGWDYLGPTTHLHICHKAKSISYYHMIRSWMCGQLFLGGTEIKDQCVHFRFNTNKYNYSQPKGTDTGRCTLYICVMNSAELCTTRIIQWMTEANSTCLSFCYMRNIFIYFIRIIH